MKSLLAQLDKVDPSFLSSAAILALVVLGFVVALITVWNGLRNRPPHESPTRREFDALATKVSHIESSLPHIERRILDAVRDESRELKLALEKLAATDHAERVEIWEKTHHTAERVATLEAKSK